MPFAVDLRSLCPSVREGGGKPTVAGVLSGVYQPTGKTMFLLVSAVDILGSKALGLKLK